MANEQARLRTIDLIEWKSVALELAFLLGIGTNLAPKYYRRHYKNIDSAYHFLVPLWTVLVSNAPL